MSLLGATILTGIATAVLAVGAIVTAVLAYLAFRKQSREVQAIERQVTDGQELARQQAELLKIQSGQLELQREQLENQRKASAKQADFLDLQAAELRESLEERKREAAARRREQASKVFTEETRHPYIAESSVVSGGMAWVRVTVSNSSPYPVYGTEIRWHMGSAPYGEPNPELVGTVMPGTELNETRHFPLEANLDVCGGVITFRDAGGVAWMLHPSGELSELGGAG